ncbi:MAG: cytochrome c [Polyangiaceae bacterium]
MNTSVSAYLGIAFAILGTGTVFLMFHLWGYPFDKATRTSAAPKSLMLLHRAMGYGFFLLYLFMMIQMVPRLMRYQVEFPARTVAHIMLGITIGTILLVKIAILRFFRHLEEWMPYLGVGLLLCTYLLIGLSVPSAFRERQLAMRVAGGDVTSPENLARIQKILPTAGLPKDAPLDALATVDGVKAGREVLLRECVQCHDLKTVLTRPRTPKDWVNTVSRMAEKPVFGDAVTEKQQWAVSTYLIAISPELQESAKKARAAKAKADDAREAAGAAIDQPVSARALKPADVKPLFEQKCSECHELDDVNKHKFADTDDVKEILERMVDNGLEATADELDAVKQYLVAVYVGRPSEPSSGGDAKAPSTTNPTPAGGGAVASAGGGTKRPTAKTPTAGDGPAPTPAPAAAAAAPAGETSEPTCGKKPLPDCPLQAWMKGNVAGALASEDFATLATGFDRIGAMAPPGYATWASLSSQGSAAAKANDMAGVRAACSGCHNQFRNKYKAEMRSRPVR